MFDPGVVIASTGVVHRRGEGRPTPAVVVPRLWRDLDEALGFDLLRDAAPGLVSAEPWPETGDALAPAVPPPPAGLSGERARHLRRRFPEGLHPDVEERLSRLHRSERAWPRGS